MLARLLRCGFYPRSPPRELTDGAAGPPFFQIAAAGEGGHGRYQSAPPVKG
jgi:hypothetical protein